MVRSPALPLTSRVTLTGISLWASVLLAVKRGSWLEWGVVFASASHTRL